VAGTRRCAVRPVTAQGVRFLDCNNAILGNHGRTAPCAPSYLLPIRLIRVHSCSSVAKAIGSIPPSAFRLRECLTIIRAFGGHREPRALRHVKVAAFAGQRRQVATGHVPINPLFHAGKLLIHPVRARAELEGVDQPQSKKLPCDIIIISLKD
jgi:hypothetical protein